MDNFEVINSLAKNNHSWSKLNWFIVFCHREINATHFSAASSSLFFLGARYHGKEAEIVTMLCLSTVLQVLF